MSSDTHIAKLNPDGSIEVLAHEPEHVAQLAKAIFGLQQENNQLRELVGSALPDTVRIDWMVENLGEVLKIINNGFEDDSSFRNEVDKAMEKQP